MLLKFNVLVISGIQDGVVKGMHLVVFIVAGNGYHGCAQTRSATSIVRGISEVDYLRIGIGYVVSLEYVIHLQRYTWSYCEWHVFRYWLLLRTTGISLDVVCGEGRAERGCLEDARRAAEWGY